MDWFERNMPLAQTELHYNDPFQLLVAVILSAQCTDKRVNMVTPPLFEKYPTPLSLASATYDEVFPYLKSVSYPNSKTRHVIAMASKLLEDFGGEVPSDIDSLMSLPGVGRKTANVIASVVYDKPVIAVDTHVFRVSHRLGLSDGKTPEAVDHFMEADKVVMPFVVIAELRAGYRNGAHVDRNDADLATFLRGSKVETLFADMETTRVYAELYASMR